MIAQNLAAALVLVLLGACTEPPTPTQPAETTSEVVVFPVEAPPSEPASEPAAARTIANAPEPCDEEPPLPEMSLPASLRVSKDGRSVALLQIEVGGAVNVTPAEDADPAALVELEGLIGQAVSEGEVTYRYVQRPDRGGNGGENCLGTTSAQSPRFALAFAHYLRSYDFRWMWDPAYYPR